MAEMYGRVTGRAAVVSATLGPGAINMQLGRRRRHHEQHPAGRDLRSGRPGPRIQGVASVRRPGVDVRPDHPMGRRRSHRRARSLRCSARRSSWQRPNARPRSTSPSPSTSTPTKPTTTGALAAQRRPRRGAVGWPGAARGRRAAQRQAAGGAGRPRCRARRRDRGTGSILRRLGVPVANTFHGKGVMPDDHPNSIGTIGFMRRDYVNFGFDTADVIVAVGYELQEFDPVRINPNADKKIIHIHRFPAEVDMHYPVTVGIIGDISASLNALTDALAGHRFDTTARRPGSGLLAEEFARGQQDSRFPLAPQRIVADTRAALGRGDVVLVDTGATKMWMARLYPTYERNTCLISNGLSTMAFALPGALGREAGQARMSKVLAVVGRRRLPDELAGDRDRGARADTAGGADLGGRRLRPDRMEDGPRTGRALLRHVHQPRCGDVRRKFWRQGISRSPPPTSCCRP